MWPPGQASCPHNIAASSSCNSPAKQHTGVRTAYSAGFGTRPRLCYFEVPNPREVTSSMRGAALELVALTKRFGATVAVDQISLKIASGTYCCLLGPSGCGKTSTLRMIAGHETVSAGAVVFGGHEITDLPPARRGAAMMFQSYALFPHLSVLDNVAFALKMRGVDRGGGVARAAA